MTKVLQWLKQPLKAADGLFWFTGGEEYLRDQALRKLRQAVLDPGFAEFNHQVLKLGSGTRLPAVLDALAELPMMTERRLLELQNVHELPAKLADELAAALQRDRYAGLVLAFTGENPKGKSALWEYLKSQATTVACEIDAKSKNEFVLFCCAQHKLELHGKQAQVVSDRCAGNLRSIEQVVERLKLFAGEAGKISDEELDQLVHDSAETQAWKLTAAIGAKQLGNAYALLHRILDQEPAQTLLSYLNSYLLGLAQVAELRPRLKTAAAIAREMPRKQEFQIKKTLEELASWGENDLAGAFEKLARADYRIKTGADPVLMLQLLILQLCSRRSP